MGGMGDKVEILAAEDFSYAVAKEETLQLALPGPGFAYAPVVEGASAGWVYALIGGNAIGKIPTVYGATIEKTVPEEKSLSQKLWDRIWN